jgi:hypothetical protein
LEGMRLESNVITKVRWTYVWVRVIYRKIRYIYTQFLPHVILLNLICLRVHVMKLLIMQVPEPPNISSLFCPYILCTRFSDVHSVYVFFL